MSTVLVGWQGFPGIPYILVLSYNPARHSCWIWQRIHIWFNIVYITMLNRFGRFQTSRNHFICSNPDFFSCHSLVLGDPPRAERNAIAAMGASVKMRRTSCCRLFISSWGFQRTITWEISWGTINNSWLVVYLPLWNILVNGKDCEKWSSWWFQPLWKIWVRQLGWLNSQYMEK